MARVNKKSNREFMVNIRQQFHKIDLKKSKITKGRKLPTWITVRQTSENPLVYAAGFEVSSNLTCPDAWIFTTESLK